ncbi:Crp/Fnr family transcriptional regulator [Sphingomonas koreensis]
MEGDAYLCAALAAILSCGDEVAAMLSAQARVRLVKRREIVACQGELLSSMWLVIDGRIKIESSSSSGRSSQLALCGPGDWIGQYAQPAIAPTDILAAEASTLLAFASGDLPRLAASHPQLGATLAASFARQLESLTAKLDARSTLTARGRICSELLRRAGDGLAITPSPVVAELAHTAQTTRETASRTIAELERRGIVIRTAASLSISSPRLLSDLVI